MPDLKHTYLVVSQVEGTVQTPLPFHVYESATAKADKLAEKLDRSTDDVRVFELDLERFRVAEVYVPTMKSSDEEEEDETEKEGEEE